MKVGYASLEITPPVGGTLCGFVSRCNQPSTGVDDPLWVRALAVEQNNVRVLLLVFDLLGLGPEITKRLGRKIDQVAAALGVSLHYQLLCTHTHSAPAAIKLLGCGMQDPGFGDLLVAAVASVATESLSNQRAATLHISTVALPNCNVNRRRIFPDGSVSLTSSSERSDFKVGPTWDKAVLLRFDDREGKGIAGFMHWAAHPVTVCSQRISADYPGELCRRLSRKFDLPFLFLQGACGNLNPPFQKMRREEMLQNVDRVMAHVEGSTWEEIPSPTLPFGWRDVAQTLSYSPLASRVFLTRFQAEMKQIAKEGAGPQKAMASLLNILNWKGGTSLPSQPLRHLAETLRQWSQDCLDGELVSASTCRAPAAVWRCGPLAFCFVGVEPFAETALALQAAVPPDVTVVLVGFSSPLMGYLPTDDALKEGGYEATLAYRFYGHPAPFAPGSEARVRQALLTEVERDWEFPK